ncbi:MAG TPA: hypothetical protein VGC60_13910 [Pyrinomonadaceae bacterium]|jgi:hypothetical protein
MSKGKFNWRKLTALVAVLVLTLIQSVSMSRARTSALPVNITSTELKLDSELRTFDSFFDDWLKVFQQHRVLSKKASVTSTEFNAFKTNSEGIKNRCSQLEGAIRDTIRKLKAADRWDGLDEEALAKADDEGLKSELREGGGLKHLLENAASQYCSQATDEIIGPIESLRPRVSAQGQDLFFEQGTRDYGLRMVRVSYNPAPPMFTHTLRCIGATIRVAVHLVATGHSGPARGNKECFCYDSCGAAATSE